MYIAISSALRIAEKDRPLTVARLVDIIGKYAPYLRKSQSVFAITS
jgi:hypothetical protein